MTTISQQGRGKTLLLCTDNLGKSSTHEKKVGMGKVEGSPFTRHMRFFSSKHTTCPR